METVTSSAADSPRTSDGGVAEFARIVRDHGYGPEHFASWAALEAKGELEGDLFTRIHEALSSASPGERGQR